MSAEHQQWEAEHSRWALEHKALAKRLRAAADAIERGEAGLAQHGGEIDAHSKVLRLERYAAYARLSGVDPDIVLGARQAIASLETMVPPSRNEDLLLEAGFVTSELFYREMAWRAWVTYA